MKLAKLALAACLPLAFTAPASAGPIEADLEACQTALTAETVLLQPAPDFDFKSSSGSQRRRIVFRTSVDSETYSVRCVVRRGEVSEIRWPDGLKAEIELAAQATTTTEAEAQPVGDI